MRTNAFGAWSLLITLAMILGACKGNPKISDKDIQIIEYEPLIKLLESRKKPTVMVDVRQAADFAKGHLPEAINIWLTDIRADDPRLAEAHNIVVYSSGVYADDLSHAAAKKYLALGYQNVYEFRGGLDLWQKQGGKLVAEEPKTP